MSFDPVSYLMGSKKGGGGGSSVTVEPLYVTENRTYTAPSGKAYSPVTVAVHPHTAVEPNHVNFIDYDGTVLYSYTTTEFAALTAMPENPSHAGLTAQGWNWTLEKAQAYVAKYGNLRIGQMYITDDGKTRVYIRLEEGRLEPYLGIGINGTAVIEWGDGTTDTVTGTNVNTVINTQHTYAAAGDYVITIDVTGSLGITGVNANGSRLLGKNVTDSYLNRIYQNAVQKIEIGRNASIGDRAFQTCYSLASITIPDGVTGIGSSAFQFCYSLASITIPDGVTGIGNSAFQGCYSLASITIPNSVTSIGDYEFQNCFSLASITIPDGVTGIGSSAFQTCYSLASITIPDGVTGIGSSAFQNCYSLASITIPDGVTGIGNSAFQGCYGLGLVRFVATTPPTVASSITWAKIPTDCVIYVPSGKLAAYTSATNYPSSSTYTYVEY